VRSLAEPEPILEVDTCERCGRRYPRTLHAAPTQHLFCEPCRDAMWRDDRRLPPASD
jgi:hypothetical protein